MIILKQNERLVYAGNAALRAPDGKLIPSIPQYMIVLAADADPTSIVTLQKNERLVMAGTVHSRTSPSDVKKLYIKEAAKNVNDLTGLSIAEEKACDAIVYDLMDVVRKATQSSVSGCKGQKEEEKI